MTTLRIKAAAKADLKRIAKFTERNWGREQRNKYLIEFDRVFHDLSENTLLGQLCDHVRAGYRAFPVGGL